MAGVKLLPVTTAERPSYIRPGAEPMPRSGLLIVPINMRIVLIQLVLLASPLCSSHFMLLFVATLYFDRLAFVTARI